jgi:hypothetical protein
MQTKPGVTSGKSDQSHEKSNRQNFDKRTIRKMYGNAFQNSIKIVRRSLRDDKDGSTIGNLVHKKVKKIPSGIKVFVRKRPLFSHEEKKVQYHRHGS